MKFVRGFERLSKDDVSIAGGKGASLGEMTKAGIQVPPGFVILSSAFEKFLEVTDLNVEIDSALDAVKHEEMHTVENAAAKIQALILGAEIPREIEEEIERCFVDLGARYVAVRSSATAEDSSSAAWAGQLESYLNTTKETLLENVRRCWASLFTPRAIFYRFEKNLRKQKISVAVVVQKMVESEKSGIAFSVHPVTQDRNQLIIEAGLGLGEAIVAGEITPDSYVVEKNPRRIIDKNVQTQDRGIYRAENGGNEWREIKREIGEKQVLSDEEIIELSEIVLRIENHYGFPCDIEWTFEDRKFYIVQSRPITTLSANQTKPEVKDLLSKIKSKSWTYYVTRKFNWFVEYTQTIASQADVQEKTFGFSFPTLNYLILNGDEYYSDKDFTSLVDDCRERFKDDENFFDSFSKNILSITQEVSDYTKKLAQDDFSKTTNVILAEHVKEFFDYYVKSFIPAWTRPDGFLELELVRLLNSDYKLDDETAEQILNKISTPLEIDKLTYSEEPLSLLLIAKQIHDGGFSIGRLPVSITKQIQNHVDKYSWLKGPVAFDELRFTKDEYLSRLENLASIDIEKRIQNIFETRKVNEQEYQDTISKYKIHGDALKLCEAVRKFIFLRTHSTEISDYLFFIGRNGLLKEAAAKLKLPSADIIMLEPDEIVTALKTQKIDQQIINERKRGFAVIWLNGKINTKFGSDAVHLQHEISSAYKTQDHTLPATKIQGSSGSNGIAQGYVKVVLNHDDADKVERGDILVASMTTPDFISAMEKVSAIVTDEGGITCHASIIAREFGIPCIIGTKIATQVLKDGDLVEVDADNGVVRILKNSKPTTILLEKAGLTFEKSITRDWGIIYAEIWHKVFTEEFKKQIGWGYTDVVFEGQNNTITVYRAPKEHIDGMRCFILSQIDKEKLWLEKHAACVKKKVEKTISWVEKMGRKRLEDSSQKELSEIFEKFIKMNIELGPQFIMMLWFPIQMENYEKLTKYKTDVDIAIETRAQIEKIGPLVDTFARKIAKEVARRAEIDDTLSRFIDIDQIKRYLKNNIIPTNKTLITRREYFIVTNDGILSDNIDDYFKKYNYSLRKIDVADIKVINGNTAYHGTVRGAVKIIRDKSTFGKLNNGEILVAPMTTPDFLPILQKAVAFITDEGGVTCHAAIIARELKKPCVIGTKIATQVLKDGDLVEVDADNGVVRILKK